MQERKRPMPVGIEDFKELVQNEYYFVVTIHQPGALRHRVYLW